MTRENQTKVLSNLPSGKLAYTMCNDYMFKAVLQKNRKALKGLLCTLLGFREEQIREIQLLNPIELGKAVDDKTCILDLKLILNNDMVLNLEMQVDHMDAWPERSLVYLSRAFDHLGKGDDYAKLHATMHIGILDFYLPHLTPQFYGEYKMLNTINHEVYSDKFALRMLNLKVLEKLTDAGVDPVEALIALDHQGGVPTDASISAKYTDLYRWASLFKATTWEELKQMAADNEYIADTIVTIQELTDDEKIRMQCEAREKYEHDRASYIKTGERIGLEKGELIGLDRLTTLILRLQQDGKNLEQITSVIQDEALRNRLFEQYGI